MRRALVQDAALRVLDELPEGETLGTMELLERLWPESKIRGAFELKLRGSFTAHLLDMRKRYPGVYAPGETIERYGRQMTRARWRRGDHAQPVVPEHKIRLKERVDTLEKRVAQLEAALGVQDARANNQPDS